MAKESMLHLFLKRAENLEYCFNVETSEPLDSHELLIFANQIPRVSVTLTLLGRLLMPIQQLH